MAIRYSGRLAAGGTLPVSGVYPSDLTPPTAVTFSPGDGSAGVLVGSNIVLIFSEPIQRGAGTIAIHLGSADGPVVESFDASSSFHLLFSGNSLTIDPTWNLSNNMHYYVTFGEGTVRDMAGNSYTGTTAYDFTTALFDNVAPTVTSFSPADGMTGVAIESNIVLSFSELIQRGAGTISIHSGSASGAVVESFNAASSSNLTFSGTTLTIDPALNLLNNTQYFVTFDAGTVKDIAGNSYIGTSTYDFKTVADLIAPIVTAYTPADGASGVAIESNIVLTFSELIQKGAGNIAIHSGSSTGTVVESFNAVSSSNLTFSGTTLTIDPTSNLLNNTHYYITVDSGTVKDIAGNGYTGTTVYDFTTAVSSSSWDNGSGRGLLNIDKMLENATGKTIADASLFGDGWGLQDWGINQIQAPDAWSAGYTGKGVIVAVIDTGVDYVHSDLISNIWKNSGEIIGNGLDDDGNGYVDDGNGWDFVNSDGDAIDDHGHGTAVAGIIAGLNNGFGVTGVACDAQIMPVKVLNSGGGGSDISIADGIYYAVNNGADVINLSLGGGYSNRIAAALQYAVNSGVLVCMASGNAAQSQPIYPALFAQTTGGIAVGAVNSSGSLAFFSNGVGTAASYDFLVAPGVDIYSTFLGESYGHMSGTSMATPFVAGAAALLLSAHDDFLSNWTLEQLENLITMSASPFLSGATFALSTLSGRRAVQSVEGIDDHFMSAYNIMDHENEQITLVGIAV